MTKLNTFKYLFTAVILLWLIPLKTTAQNLPTAMEAYENLQYNIALKYFNKAWKKDKNNLEINYFYGKSILKANTDRSKAIPFLEFIVGENINYKDVTLELGQAYIYKQEFTKAQQSLNYFIKNIKAEKNADESLSLDDKKDLAKKLLKQIESAKALLKKPIDVSFHNLGALINTKRSDYNPFITHDGKTLYFTNDNKYDSDLLELINNGYSSKFNPELNTWQKMKSLGKELNTSEHEIVVGLSKDEEKLIINVNWMQEHGDIFLSSIYKNKSKSLKELEKNINSDYNESSGSLSLNNDTIYFSSDRPGGYGGQDLYMSVHLPNGSWGLPINLGSEINTKYNEAYPSPNENKLQFSSDRPASMGGYDIFVATKNKNKWISVNNMGYPINDFYDNHVISYSMNKRYGYMSKIRPEGYGAYDIYQVVFNTIDPQYTIFKGTIKKGDKKHSNIIEGKLKIEAFKKGEKKLYAKSKYFKDGKYTFAFPPGEYNIKISGAQFEEYTETIIIPENEPLHKVVTKNILVQ